MKKIEKRNHVGSSDISLGSRNYAHSNRHHPRRMVHGFCFVVFIAISKGMMEALDAKKRKEASDDGDAA